MDKIDSKPVAARPARGGAADSGCGCPVTAFQRLISGKYKLRIVWDLQDGARRYSEIRGGLLRGAVGSQLIAPRVLSRELKALTQAGLIERIDYGLVPPKVEYRLTRKGETFVPVIAAIRNWGMRHLQQDAAATQPVSARTSNRGNKSAA
ncbi:MAG TPA: helix-turn-helix domain-containing protein [Burkholderiaceae bacterium]|nr:helix-turn-helix domain-containing protein [Burkholderiaceae bacterium]